MTLLERFEAKYTPEPNSGCWLWFAANDGKGYGRIKHGDRPVQAYKVAFELFRGPVPEGLELDHLCRIRCCVNPWHLEAVPHRENIRRSPTILKAFALKGGGVYQKAKTHCPSGHPYSPENTYINRRNNNRKCRTCHLLRSKAKNEAGTYGHQLELEEVA